MKLKLNLTNSHLRKIIKEELEEVFGGVTSTGGERTSRGRQYRASDGPDSTLDVPSRGRGDVGSRLTTAAMAMVQVLQDYNIEADNNTAAEIAMDLMQKYDLD